MKKVYIYSGFERFWHWAQSVLIFFLGVTGFEIHGSLSFFGFENAVKYHTIAAYSFIVLIVFAMFWHFVTGEWRQYIPTLVNLRKQIEYYVTGIFRNAPHPTRRTQLSKLNPLQRLVYLGLKIVVFPVMVGTGLLYTIYRFPQDITTKTVNVGSLEIIAVIHTLGAFVLVSFVIMHVYLISTGSTPTAHLSAMITGYEEIEEDENDKEEAKTEQTV